MAYKYPICDVFHWFCKIVRFFATEPEKALPLSQRALEIDEKVLGPQHPSVATSLNNLAVLYKEMGDYEKALPLSQRTLEICEKILGPKHPNTMIIRNNFMQSANNREDKKEN